MNEALESLFVLGISHHETPLDIREQFALTEVEAKELQNQIFKTGGIRECLVLNTCNRIEIYSLAEKITLTDIISRLYCDMKGLPPEQFAKYAYRHNNLGALQHVLEVSTGLDSQMVGETEILGQLKQAYITARDAKTTGKVLNRLFEKSFQAAKEARTLTSITRGQISIGNVTVDLASRIFGKLTQSRILLIGSGEVGEKTAQSLKSRGAGDISVSSRTFKNAHLLAQKLGGTTIELEDIIHQVEHFDIIICSTASPGLVLCKDTITKAMRSRPERPCFMIDLALPRDIDPKVEEIENVYLYNLDDLSSIANENLKARKAEIETAREILKKHAWNLWLQLRRREIMRHV